MKMVDFLLKFEDQSQVLVKQKDGKDMDISTMMSLTIDKYFDVDSIKAVREQSTTNLTKLIEEYPNKDEILKGALSIIQNNQYDEFHAEDHAFFCSLIKEILRGKIEILKETIPDLEFLLPYVGSV